MRLNRDGSTGAPGRGFAQWHAAANTMATNMDYRGAVQYSWTDDVMTYLQYSTGFKGGGVSPRPFVAAQATAFGPETLKTWEVGVKADLFDRQPAGQQRGVLSASTMICSWACRPARLGAASPCGRSPTRVLRDIKGFEMEALSGQWLVSVDASYSYTDFKYTRSDQVPVASS